MTGQRISNKQLLGQLQQLSSQFHFYMESHERMGRALATMTAKVDQVLQETEKILKKVEPVEIPEDSEEDDPPYDFLME